MTEPVTQVPALDTARLRLRCLTIEDAPAAHQAYGDPEVMRFWDMPPSIDLEETERRLKRSLSVEPHWHATWAVLARPDGQLPDDQFIGMINYHARQPWNRRLALGWILISRFQRRGFMEEAVRAVLTHCFNTLNTHRVEAQIEPDNLPSAPPLPPPRATAWVPAGRSIARPPFCCRPAAYHPDVCPAALGLGQLSFHSARHALWEWAEDYRVSGSDF